MLWIFGYNYHYAFWWLIDQRIISKFVVLWHLQRLQRKYTFEVVNKYWFNFQPFPILIVTLFTPQSKETQPVCLFVEILVRPFSSFSL